MSGGTYLSFMRDADVRQVLLGWWGDLEINRADRATLRRCRSAGEVALHPAYHRLRRALRGSNSVNSEALAVVAGLLAHVRVDNPGLEFPAQMARPKGEGRGAAVSGLRFRRLLRIEQREDLLGPIIRVVALLGGKANVASLADSVYWWNENTRKRWALAYYENAPEEK
ncbi:MAG: type I-E CRISPR-associated protein Cse2/CasB [Deltaproteobacteria bacterium]|nr:MAG: type I-E CRISPR-associated protein Cse2/CasB [Deltaproteobacteria bacterium]